MKEQLISIAVGGAMKSLQLKHGLDLRRFGKVSIVRSSLIKWSESEQKWFIELVGSKVVVTDSVLRGVGLRIPSTATCDSSRGCGILYFAEYDDAVACEIDAIQTIRRVRGTKAVV